VSSLSISASLLPWALENQCILDGSFSLLHKKLKNDHLRCLKMWNLEDMDNSLFVVIKYLSVVPPYYSDIL
jgi:hypothetical protein